MASKNTIEIVINQTGNAIKGVGAFIDTLTSAASGAIGAAKAVVDFGKAVYEVGRAGAQVAQTRDSFDRLGVSLEALKKASGGTIDDMTLMSSTLTLMAGSTGALNESFKTAAPGLLEMAKAAAKLNPTLGDTKFMYESLALGIKRGSPMILDNLGIIVSQETANRKYAEAIGKSVSALTDEEKKIALLNETMAKGNVLLEQAGGTTASATDGFDRFKAALGNYTDAAKEAYAGTGGLFDKMAGFLEWAAGAQRKWTEFFGTITGMKPALDGAGSAVDKFATGMKNAVMQVTDMNSAAGSVTTTVGQNQMAMEKSMDAIVAYEEAIRKAAEAAFKHRDAVLDEIAAIGEMSKAQITTEEINKLKEAYDKRTITEEEYLSVKQKLLISSGLMTEAEAQQYAALETVRGALEDNKVSGDGYVATVMSIAENIERGQAVQDAYAQAIEERAKPAIDRLTESMLAGKMGPEEYALAVGKIRAEIEKLKDKKVTVEVEYVKTGAPPEEHRGVGQTGGSVTAMQAGFDGIFTRPTMAIFGEGGPERVIAQPMNNTTNFNLSVNSTQSAGSITEDFNMMRAFVGR